MYRTKSQLIGNVSTGASFSGIITAPGLSVDTVNISGASTIANVTFSSGIITATSGVVTFYGDGSGLTGISAGSTVFDDTSTNSTFYPVFTNTTSGLLSTSRVSTTKLSFNPSSSTLNVGTGITLSGSDGSISIAGTIYASSLNIPIEVSSFSPAIGATEVSIDSNVTLTFNQTVGLGSTGFVQIKIGSATTGANNQTIYPVNTTLSNGGTVLKLNNLSFPNATNDIFPVMSPGFVVANGSNFAGINTVGSATTYKFTTKPVSLGDAFGGGYLICQSGGTRWVVAPSSAQYATAWGSRANAVTYSETVTGCTGWFVPSCAQLKNPGATCATYWDSTTPYEFWSDTANGPEAWVIIVLAGHPLNGNAYPTQTFRGCPVRTFRCVTY